MYILYRRVFGPSARAVAESLGIQATSHPQSEAPVIRWGSADGYYEHDTEFNSKGVIVTSGSKPRLSALLRDAGVDHIEFHNRVPRADEYPVVLRTLVSSHGGKGIIIAKTPEEYIPGTWWSKWYDFPFELGVHVLGGKIARIFRKVREDGKENEEYPIRNMSQGYRFSLVSSPSYMDELQRYVSLVYNAFQLEFGRLDIGYDSKTMSFRLIESNTAPGIAENSNTIKVYADYLRSKLEL